MYAQDNNPLPVWIILSQPHHHISINSQPFLVGIVSPQTPGLFIQQDHIYGSAVCPADDLHPNKHLLTDLGESVGSNKCDEIPSGS